MQGTLTELCGYSALNVITNWARQKTRRMSPINSSMPSCFTIAIANHVMVVQDVVHGITTATRQQESIMGLSGDCENVGSTPFSAP